MIEANKNELFPITVSLFDEIRGELVGQKQVIYDIRTIDDNHLTPSVTGTLSESSVEDGIYKTELSLPESGSYICYATCSGFITSTEEIMISNENIYEITKENRSYNTSVIDVPRITVSGSGNSSQIARNVPVGKTDYIITKVKRDDDVDWTNPVSSGTSYAHYTSMADTLPYMMGGAF